VSKSGLMERQMWDKHYISNAGLNSPNIYLNEKNSLANESHEIPNWVGRTSEKK